jgi:hypothetical protein
MSRLAQLVDTAVFGKSTRHSSATIRLDGAGVRSATSSGGVA